MDYGVVMFPTEYSIAPAELGKTREHFPEWRSVVRGVSHIKDLPRPESH